MDPVPRARARRLLQNLSIKASALQKFQLPIVVKAGTIGRVELQIPWSKLANEPTRLRMDSLLLLVGPQSESEWDQQAESLREVKRKQLTLAAHEATHHSAAAAKPAPKSNSFAARLSAKVLDKLQVRVLWATMEFMPCASIPPGLLAHFARRCCAGRHYQRGHPVCRQLSWPVHVLDDARNSVDRPALCGTTTGIGGHLCSGSRRSCAAAQQ
ncbi:UHRF1BP1/VPS13 N-terminal domain-containing protein [bacterium]|nr:UHRF1BP1/VPS13 N-terminal domain-containing protein [bacterium]